MDKTELRSVSPSRQRPTEQTVPIRAVRHAIQVLTTFSMRESLLGVNEIARRVGLHKTTVSRILSTLEEDGLVERDGASGRYRLGVGVVALAGPLLANLSVLDVARPFLAALAAASDETVSMNVWNGREAINVEQVLGPGAAQHIGRLGNRNPPHASATGKALLAHAAPDEVRAVLARGLPRLTARTIVDPAQLVAELERVRQRGYAINDRESDPAVVSVAAVACNYRNQIVAAIAISAPSDRVTPERRDHLLALVRETAAAISLRLGYAGPPATLQTVTAGHQQG